MRYLILLVLLIAGALIVPRMTPAAEPDGGAAGFMEYYSFPAELNLESDICHHDQYIWGEDHPPPHNIKLQAYIGYTATSSITGPAPWIEVRGEYGSAQPFEAGGTGVVAGFPNIPVHYRQDTPGRALTSLAGGVYRMGAEVAGPGQLPPCDDDNSLLTPPEVHAVYYRVKAKPPTPTPTPTPTPCPDGKVPIYLLPNLASGCGTPTPFPTAIGQPTDTPTPTNTPGPTGTPLPTGTPMPTVTGTPPTATATPEYCVMGPQSCTPTPTPGPRTGIIVAGCDAEVTITNTGLIMATSDGIKLDCKVQYNTNDLRPGNPNAQIHVDTNVSEVHIDSNGNITDAGDGITVEMDDCTPVQVNMAEHAAQALQTACKMIIRAFHNLGGSGMSAGVESQPYAVFESEPFAMTANASFPPFAAHWKAAPNVHAALTDTSSQAVVGYITGWAMDMSPFGDVNCNFASNAIDAALLLQMLAARVASLHCQIAGDVDRNFVINAIDAALVLQYTAGHIPGLPTGG